MSVWEMATRRVVELGRICCEPTEKFKQCEAQAVTGTVVCGLSSLTRRELYHPEDHCGNRALSPWLIECSASASQFYVVCHQVGLSSESTFCGLCDFPSLCFSTGWIITEQGLKPETGRHSAWIFQFCPSSPNWSTLFAPPTLQCI
jgi:hypothetical protein